jgi:hypothetical protein
VAYKEFLNPPVMLKAAPLPPLPDQDLIEKQRKQELANKLKIQ